MRLWAWTAAYAPTGNVTPDVTGDVDVAVSAGLPRGSRGPGVTFEALVRAGWIDAVGEGNFAVHDWAEVQQAHAEKAEHKAKLNRERQQRYRDRKKQRDAVVASRNASREEEKREEESKEEPAPAEQPPSPPAQRNLLGAGSAAAKPTSEKSRKQPKAAPDLTLERTACRDRVRDFYQAEQARLTSKPLVMDKLFNVGLLALCAAVQDDPAEAIALIQRAQALGAQGDPWWSAKWVSPSMVAREVNSLRQRLRDVAQVKGRPALPEKYAPAGADLTEEGRAALAVVGVARA